MLKSIQLAAANGAAYEAARAVYHEARAAFIEALGTGQEAIIVPAHLDALAAFNQSERAYRRYMGAAQ